LYILDYFTTKKYVSQIEKFIIKVIKIIYF